jgi:hypothetical protein
LVARVGLHARPKIFNMKKKFGRWLKQHFRIIILENKIRLKKDVNLLTF